MPIRAAPSKNLGHIVSGELPWLAPFHMHHNSLLEELGLHSHAWLPAEFTTGTFPFAGLALHPFPVINDSHVYDYMLSPETPDTTTDVHFIYFLGARIQRKHSTQTSPCTPLQESLWLAIPSRHHHKHFKDEVIKILRCREFLYLPQGHLAKPT